MILQSAPTGQSEPPFAPLAQGERKQAFTDQPSGVTFNSIEKAPLPPSNAVITSRQNKELTHRPEIVIPCLQTNRCQTEPLCAPLTQDERKQTLTEQSSEATLSPTEKTPPHFLMQQSPANRTKSAPFN